MMDGEPLKDTAGFPPLITTKPLLSRPFSISVVPRGVLTGPCCRLLRWSLQASAPAFYRVGSDSPIGDAISAEDFAVAIVDELEKPAHTGTRFTVAN